MKQHMIRRLATDPKDLKTKTSAFKLYVRLLGYVWEYKTRLFLALGAIVAIALLEFAIPQITRIVIDEVIPDSKFALLGWVAAGIMGIAFLLGIFHFISSYTMSKVGQLTIFDIRNQLYHHLQHLSMSFFDNRRTGELMSRVTNDINTLQQLITSGVISIVKDLLIFFVIVFYLFYTNWQLALFILITFPPMIYMTRRFGIWIRHSYKGVQEQAANVNDHLQDTISSMKLIKSFANEKYETKRFSKHNRRNMEANVSAVRLWAAFGPVIDLLNYVGYAVVIAFGAWQVMSNRLMVGELVAFIAYLHMVQQPIRRFSRIINIIQQAAASSERIFEILDTKSELVEKEDAFELPHIKGHVRFENVQFAYKGGEQVLKNFTLDISPGMTVALVGPSGAGKSTVANIVARFYDPQEGRLLIDDYDLRDVTLDSLRGQMGIVSQEILLLNGNIRENIAYGKPDATDEEIIQAAKMANAHEFIMNFPQRYDSPIGERGIKLSGGQRQRLSIARAILKSPRFLILDEATSSLDTESEHLIQEALDKLLLGRTSVIIAHRLSTIQQADLIVVLEDGHIAELGTHRQLLAKGGRYADLLALQFPKELEEEWGTSG